MTTFTGITYPEYLAMLTAVLEAYCRKMAIEPGSSAYEDAGQLLIALFNNGVSSPEELTEALDRSNPLRRFA